MVMRGIMQDSKTILFIDDEETLCKALGKHLQKIGYSVKTAFSGKEGIETFKKEPFDLVITDLKMGDKSGIEVTEEIKKIRPDTAVMILTGYGTMDTAIQAIRLHVEDYILKPIMPLDLISKVEKCLKNRYPENKENSSDFRPSYKQDLNYKDAHLTRREQEVARLASEGFNDDEIARILDISVFTVKFHLKKVFKKLNIHKRIQLIMSSGN